MTPRALPLLVPLALVACGDDGTTAGAATCRLTGEATQLPYTRDFDLAALGERFVLVTSGETGVEARVVSDTAITAPEALQLAKGPVSLAATSGSVLAQTWSLSWQTSAPRLATFTGSAWSVETASPLEGGALSTRGGTLAATETGSAITAFWVEGVSTPKARVAAWSGDTFGPIAEVMPEAGDLSGYTVHAAYDGQGRLHLATVGDLGGESGLLHAVKDGDTWTTTRVGPTPGYFQNTVTTAMTVDAAGAVWLAEVHGADFFEDTTAGFTFWRDSGAGRTIVARPGESRLVVEGLDLAALSDGRVLATSSWGDNDLAAATSDDSVTLTVCGLSACGRALVLDGRRGVFYEATHVAAAGLTGVAAWAWTEKGQDGAKGLTVQRFTCDPVPALSR